MGIENIFAGLELGEEEARREQENEKSDREMRRQLNDAELDITRRIEREQGLKQGVSRSGSRSQETLLGDFPNRESSRAVIEDLLAKRIKEAYGEEAIVPAREYARMRLEIERQISFEIKNRDRIKERVEKMKTELQGDGYMFSVLELQRLREKAAQELMREAGDKAKRQDGD